MLRREPRRPLENRGPDAVSRVLVAVALGLLALVPAARAHVTNKMFECGMIP